MCSCILPTNRILLFNRLFQAVRPQGTHGSWLWFGFQICLLLVVILVAIASGYCIAESSGTASTTTCETRETPFTIDHWNDENTYKELKAQYFVFIAALVFFMVSVALIFLSCNQAASKLPVCYASS